MPNLLAALRKIDTHMTAEQMIEKKYDLALIEGHLGKDPEFRTKASGKELCKTSVAVSFGRRGEDQRTEWWEVIAWGAQAAILACYTKGQAIAVWGKISVNAWTGNDGVERKTSQLSAWGIADPVWKVEQRQQTPLASSPGGGQTQTSNDDIPF